MVVVHPSRLSSVALLALAIALAIALALGTTEATFASTPAADPSLPRRMPPGAQVDDPGPSRAIFPDQTLTIRFDHKQHMTRDKLACTSCHPSALTSHLSRDLLTAKPMVCDRCHGSNHADLSRVIAGEKALGACATCHIGYAASDGNRVATLAIPAPNLVFDHQKHAARNIGCARCHGAVEEVGTATREQLPRMRGCLGCHQHPDSAARGDARGSCETCHLATRDSEGARITTAFSSGRLLPPRWMHNAAHDADFLTRHKYVAANDSAFCANCHREDECVACHDGRVRPRSIHPSDYLSMHAVEASLASSRCSSCHREQSFCLSCHQRLGVAMSGPTARSEPGRFHPPKAIWSDAPRRPGHHAMEAIRNLNACVSCHIERDCVACHGGQGVGGGFSPHGPGYGARCASQLRRNPRPCFVCHDPGSETLRRCE